MVLTSCPSAITASVVQDLTALPSRCTTQAPHWEVSQPTWVPVSRRFSRRNCTRRVRESTLALTGLPFTISEILAIQYSLHLHGRISAAQSSKPLQAHNMGHPGNEQPHPGMVYMTSAGPLTSPAPPWRNWQKTHRRVSWPRR